MLATLILSVGLTLAQPIVVDGDTLRDGGERYRVENIDAPERGAHAQCQAERVLAEAATTYLTRWVAGATHVEAALAGRRDRYGRIVARIVIDGADLGERLMARGLAQP